jgi:predicted lipoprotein with Yx(FWY)xxD motif
MVAGAAVVAVSASTLGVALSVPAASARPTTAAKVVKIDLTEDGHKNVLNNLINHPLYTATTCTGSCLQVWPPLLMPKGTTTPTGAPSLGTAKFGTRLQVTYKGHRLYTFVSDAAGDIDGNHVAGFTVIQGV